MKKVVFVFSLLAIFSACKKSSSDAPAGRTGPNVGATGISQNFTPGSSIAFNYYYTGVSSLSATTGTGQAWNYAALTTPSFADTLHPAASSNASFPTATYTRSNMFNYGLGGASQNVNVTTYYEVSANGWLELGRSLPAFVITIPATGTVNFAAQSNAYTPNKLPLTPPLPTYYGDSVNFSSMIQESGTANAPSYFLVNAPVTEKTTYVGSVKSAGTGTIVLPGAATTAAVPALLIRRTMTRTTNFLLNGATPPAPLLAVLGIVDGQATSEVYYDFYSTDGQGFLGSIYQQAGVTQYAYFRKYN
jgi:hypothetical protein